MKDFIGITKEELEEIFKRLGIKDPYKEKFSQETIEVPEVGTVSVKPVYLDQFVRKCSEGIIRLDKRKEGDTITMIEWFESMMLAEKMGVKLLSCKDYWKCYEWALSKNTLFAKSLRENTTWIGTTVVWAKEPREELEYLVKQYPKISLPLVVEDIKVTRSNEGYILSGGNVVIPESRIMQIGCHFGFKCLDEETGLPTKSAAHVPAPQALDKFNVFFYIPSTAFAEKMKDIAQTNCNVMCDGTTLYADRYAEFKSKNLGFFCKL